jgi:hypothetical protein
LEADPVSFSGTNSPNLNTDNVANRIANAGAFRTSQLLAVDSSDLSDPCANKDTDESAEFNSNKAAISSTIAVA